MGWKTLLNVSITQRDLQNQCSFFQNLDVFLTEIEKPILKFTWNLVMPQIAKTVLKKKNKIERLTPPDYKTYYKSTIIKTVWYLHKDI